MSIMPPASDSKPCRDRREAEFLRHYDPALDDPIDTAEPSSPRYRVRYSPAFVAQMRRLGSPRFPLAPVSDAA